MFLLVDYGKVSFSLSRNKRKIGNRPVGESEKMKCFKGLIYFPSLRSLWPTVSSSLPKRFTHLCRALYGDAVMMYRFGTPIMAAGNQQKHVGFTFSIKALSFHSRTSIRAHKHIL